MSKQKLNICNRLINTIYSVLFHNVNSLVKATYKHNVMTIEFSDGEKEQYKGSCTVWHKMPMMKRCSTITESKLSEIWSYINHYGGSYPNSHKNNN